MAAIKINTITYKPNLKTYKIKKVAAYLGHYGPVKLARKAAEKVYFKDDYSKNWINYQPDANTLALQTEDVFDYMPKISILVPVCDPKEVYFKALLESVIHQSYPVWELCIVDAGKRKLGDFIKVVTDGDSRIKYAQIDNKGISENTNKALEMAEGDYLTLLDHDDTLSLQALYLMVKNINETGADCLYSDEDKMNSDGSIHFTPHSKPDFNMGLLRSNNYICHLFMIKTDIAKSVGGFNSEFDGSQDYDFIFRCVEKAQKVSHISEVLYHWRTHEASTSDNPMSKLYAYEAGRRVIEAHLKRLCIKAKVTMRDDFGFYQVHYELKENPKVKVVVLGAKDNENAQNYFRYLRAVTEYDNLTMCAMNEPVIERIDKLDAEYLVILKIGMRIKDRKWLKNLAASCLAQKADASAAKLTIKGCVVYGGSTTINGECEYQQNIGLPKWFKGGSFNTIAIQQEVGHIPPYGIFVKKDIYSAMLECHDNRGFDAWGERFVYEPDTVIKLS